MMKKRTGRTVSFVMAIVLSIFSVTVFGTTAYADNFSVESWDMHREDGFWRFSVTETGNQWGHGVNGTSFVIDYPDGSSSSFQVGYNLLLKNSTYGDIDGGEITAVETSRGGVYDVEIRVPDDYFAGDEFSVTYNGSTISTEDITTDEAEDETEETDVTDETGEDSGADIKETEGSDEESSKENEKPVSHAAYKGIDIDGDFADWDAVAKNAVDDGSLKNIAMVFDGEDIFIYMEEPEGSAWNVAAGAGVTADGKFAITSDTGKQSIFYVDTKSIHERDGDVIEGSSVVFAGSRAEIRLPASFVKEYNETISLGYFNGNERLVADVANLQGHSSSQKDKNDGSGISMGDGFYDWTGYPHSTIAYSTTDSEGSGAIYSDGSKAYIHEITSNSVDHSEYAGNLTPFTISLNGDQKVHEKLVYLKLISADAAGNTTDNGESDLRNLTPGSYTFYVADNTVAWGFWNWNVNNAEDIHHEIYGKAHVSVTETGYEMECDIDLEKLARVYSAKTNTAFTANDIKKIEVQFGDIGQQWISYSGTSTGPVAGVILAIALSFGAIGYHNKRKYGSLFYRVETA